MSDASISTDPRSLPADVKRKLLAARDALTEGDAMEAYHQIYSIAAPHFDKLADEVWTGLESPSPEPSPLATNSVSVSSKSASPLEPRVDVADLNRELCEKEGHVLGVECRPCLRCHAQFAPTKEVKL